MEIRSWRYLRARATSAKGLTTKRLPQYSYVTYEIGPLNQALLPVFPAKEEILALRPRSWKIEVLRISERPGNCILRMRSGISMMERRAFLEDLGEITAMVLKDPQKTLRRL